MTLSSFDIFDTTLIRKCGEAENVFWIMAKRLFPGDKDKQYKFVMWRKTTNCTVAKKNVNYTLDNIYSEDVNTLFSYTSEFLLKTEYETEAEMLVANPIIIKKIEEQRNKGNRIAFISDMYLSSTFLKDILVREGAFKDGDELFVSCEYNARKDDGLLFGLVRNEMNPSKWIHYGDNELSDFRIPRKKGIKANLVNYGYTEIEKKFEKSAIGFGGNSDYSILIGYLRYLRLTGNSTPEDYFAIDYIAPLYYGYIKHVLDDAKNRGLKTLYFLSRDGYIFFKIAEQIPHDGIELKYLYISRKSIQPAFRHIATDVEYRTSINGEKLDIERLDTDKNDYDLLDAYFVQEGVYNEEIALVDLGWYGSTRLMVNKLREHKGLRQCFCYYLGVVNNCLPEVYGKFNAYTYSDRIANNPWYTFLLEEYFSLCPHPTTIGYQRKKETIGPILDKYTIVNKQYIEANIINSCRLAKEDIPVSNFTLIYYWGNVLYSMEHTLEKKYACLLFKVCRKEEYLFRKFTWKDIYIYIRDLTSITLNDSIACSASFSPTTVYILNMMRNTYIKLRDIKYILTR